MQRPEKRRTTPNPTQPKPSEPVSVDGRPGTAAYSRRTTEQAHETSLERPAGSQSTQLLPPISQTGVALDGMKTVGRNTARRCWQTDEKPTGIMWVYPKLLSVVVVAGGTTQAGTHAQFLG